MGRLNTIRRFGAFAGHPLAAQAPVPSGTSSAAIGDAAVMAARQRIANGSRDPKDRELVEQYREQQTHPEAPRPAPAATPPTSAPPAITHGAHGTYAQHGKHLPSWMAKDGTGDGIATVDYRDPKFAPGGSAEKPVHVEVTDKSADKIGQGLGRRGLMKYAEGNKAIGKAARDLVEAHRRSVEVRNHLAATQIMLRAHQGRILGVDPHSTLGRHIRHSIDNSRRQVSIVHNPTYTMHGVADPAAALSDAHRLAGRGQADLVRNLSTMTS